MTTATKAQAPNEVQPTVLSYSRALLSSAKAQKLTYWRLEILAALLSVGGAFVPWPKLAAVAGVLSVAAKVASKLKVSASKKTFRTGERARRYDFYSKTLAWAVPPTDRADMVLARNEPGIEQAARAIASKEIDYYAHAGPPSVERLWCNLVESMFWTERLMASMAKVRWRHFSFAALAVVIALVGTVVIQPAENALMVLKFLGAAVALLVAVDVFGEATSFGRGEREIGRLLQALLAEIGRPNPSREEGLRLMVEYNCTLADLPLLPDSIYNKNQNSLNAAWDEFEKSIPIRCGPSSVGL